MSQVTQSPFLQALGYAIINSLWQFALLWLIYVCVNTCIKLSAHQKYTAGILIQTGGFIWFAATFNYYLQQFIKLEEIYFLQEKKFSLAFAHTDSASFEEKFFSGIIQTEILLPYLSIAYLLILVLLCVRWARIYYVTKTIKTKGIKKIDVDWRLFVKRLSAQLGIKREVKIFLSEKVTTPLTIGFFKPLILIPLASLNHLNSYQMEAIILHELAHIKRFDYLFNLFLAIIDITLFFNPFTILISKNIRRERENCCDDWVLQYEYNPASYATALLQIATYSSSLLAMQASDNKHVLLNRIKRMIEKKENTFFNYRYQLIALFVMLTVAGSLALLSSSHNINKAAVSSSSKPVVTPMAEVLNSPLFNPDFFMTSDEERDIKRNELITEKKPDRNFGPDVLNRNFASDPLIQKNMILVNNEPDRQKQSFKFQPAEKKRALPEAPQNPEVTGVSREPFEDLITNIETSNAGLQTQASGVEDQAGEAADQLQKVITEFVEGNREAIDQRRLSDLKAAIAELRKTNEQPTVKQRMWVLKQRRNDLQLEKLRLNSVITQAEMNKLQELTEKLQFEAEDLRKQAERTTEKMVFLKNYRAPKVVCRFPAEEKVHTFSFELSADPRVKVAVPQFYFKPQKLKKTDKISPEKENKIFNPQVTFPPEMNNFFEKVTKGGDDFLIIRI